MAKYIITQKLNLNGKSTSASITVNGGDDDVTALTALMEGSKEVKEVNETLSDLTGADTLVTNVNAVTSIGLVGSQNQYASIKAYSGSIYFKNTASVDDIANVCKEMQPFPLLPTEKPNRVNVKRSETFI